MRLPIVSGLVSPVRLLPVWSWLLPLLVTGPVQAGDIVIGMSAAFKGPSRGLGIELYRGSMAYFEHVNRTGGIRGRKIQIKAYNDGYNPLPAIENTERLVEQDKVLLLYGYVGTPTVTRILPLLKLYEDKAVFLFFPFTGAQPQRLPPYNAFVFNLRASYFRETADLVERFVDIGRKRIAVFYQMDSYGRGGWDGVRQALSKRRLKIVAEATYKRGDKFSKSFRPQVDILKKAAPDAVICVGAYAGCAGFIREARDVGWTVPIANVSFVGSENLLELLLKAGKANDKDYTRDLINSQVVPSYLRRELPAVRQYRKLMKQYNPMPPSDLLEKGYDPLLYSYVSFEGFLNAKLLAHVLKKMGTPVANNRLKSAVESMKNIDLGIDVPVSFGPGNHQGLDKVYFTTVEKGRFVPLVDWRKWRK
jgi:branched-chain amino acid transport system substrate-binding protein